MTLLQQITDETLVGQGQLGCGKFFTIPAAYEKQVALLCACWLGELVIDADRAD